ncbi:hypothetical protein LOAG_14432, partial [Loa loa]
MFFTYYICTCFITLILHAFYIVSHTLLLTYCMPFTYIIFAYITYFIFACLLPNLFAHIIACFFCMSFTYFIFTYFIISFIFKYIFTFFCFFFIFFTHFSFA